jgi:hypothetical protein
MSYATRLFLAVVAYIGLYGAATSVDWVLRTPRPGRLWRAAELTRAWLDKLWLSDLLRCLFYLLGPYWILTSGWASPVDLGLADLSWPSGVGLTLAIGAGSLLLLGPMWWQCLRVTGSQAAFPQADWLGRAHGWAFVLQEAILLEVWWVTCRSPMLMFAGPYLGVYLGLALAFAAGLLNPSSRYELRTPGLRDEVALTSSLAVLSTTLYIFVHNLWLCIAMHFVLRTAMLWLVHKTRAAAISGESATARPSCREQWHPEA